MSFANFFFKKTPYNLKELAEIVDAAYSARISGTRWVQKKTFSPSTLGYSSGTCPRKWVMLFQGAESYEEYDPKSVDNMTAGTDAHERIQSNMHNANEFTLDIEWDLHVEDPPIHGYVDAIIRDFYGYDIVVEIKTTRSEAFLHRQANNKGPDYQTLQLLLYMYFLDLKFGLLMYENKNDHDKILIPVEMTSENRRKIEEVIEWLRKVHATYEAGQLPKKPFRSNSKECKSCPLKKWCDDKPEGDVEIDKLEFEF